MQWGGGIFRCLLQDSIPVFLFAYLVFILMQLLSYKTLFSVKLASPMCVFMSRPAIWIRTFWFIESVLSTSWVLVSTPCFFLFAGHDKAGKTKRGYLFTGQMCFILFATFPFFFPFFAFFLIFYIFSSVDIVKALLNGWLWPCGWYLAAAKATSLL